MYTLKELCFYFLKLGTWGFGGPVALIGYMHRDLVLNYKWISEDDYREGLALAQLAPGPLAAQLAIYIGYVHYKIMGATFTGLAFIFPSFCMVVLIGWAYVEFQGLVWVQVLFYGVSAAVIGIISLSCYRLTVKTIRTDIVAWIIFTVLASVTILLESEIIWLIVAGGFLMVLAKSRQLINNGSGLLSLLFLQLPVVLTDSIFIQIAIFFGTAGAFVFGSGLAIVPFLYGGLVTERGWLTEQQFLDAVAIAMITPGPVVITVGFIGYLIAGFPGACIAAIATFFPCYIFTIIPAPYFKKYGKKQLIKTFVEGVTVAAIGAIAGAVVVIAKKTLSDWFTVAIAISTVIILVRFSRIKEPVVIAIMAVCGLIFKGIL
ncbi:chromate transporter [bacterium]|nr:chromate transporter [bacterium]